MPVVCGFILPVPACSIRLLLLRPGKCCSGSRITFLQDYLIAEQHCKAIKIHSVFYGNKLLSATLWHSCIPQVRDTCKHKMPVREKPYYRAKNHNCPLHVNKPPQQPSREDWECPPDVLVLCVPKNEIPTTCNHMCRVSKVFFPFSYEITGHLLLILMLF